nr:hypothetical protein [Prevotella sp.]
MKNQTIPQEYEPSPSEVEKYIRLWDSLDNYVNQENYGLTAYNLKEIDKYLWQLGKSYYKKYN